MCGIAGIAGYNGNPVQDMEAMNSRLIRRGPDAGGRYMDENRHVIMGHRRLSIIDLSDAGAQPMESHSGRYVMAYNGEIYNAHDLLTELEESSGPVRLRGTSDSEILLEAIDVFGLDTTLKKCRGMWAISLYDRLTGDILLTRDRIGEKPLYYGTVRGQFVWASDIGAISAIEGFDNTIDPRVIPIYLRYGYIPAPYTIYKDIYKLMPGTILTVHPPYHSVVSDAPANVSAYYDISQVAAYGQSHLFDGSEGEAADELEALLKKALKGQMLSDVPLGAFLSGGIDSTLVVSLMQQLSEHPVRTFTIGFEEDGYNEASFALNAAKLLGTEHTEMYVGYRDVMELLPSLSEAYGEPFADSSQLPTMLVSKMTRQHVTVALSGDAGDEFYCGYNTYKDAKTGLGIMRGKLGFLKGNARKIAGHMAERLNSMTSHSYNDFSRNVHKLDQVLNTDSIEDYYLAMSDSIYVPSLINSRYPSGDLLETSNGGYTAGLLPDPESNLMLMDMLQYLPDDILTKVDRAGMYYSLETRIPLLDADVMAFAWSLPLSYKLSGGITKKPLRNILYRYVPMEMMDRPKKGFSVPVSRWLREGEMNEWAESILSDSRSIASDYLDMKTFDRIWQQYKKDGRYTTVIWYVLVFCQWLSSLGLSA